MILRTRKQKQERTIALAVSYLVTIYSRKENKIIKTKLSSY